MNPEDQQDAGFSSLEADLQGDPSRTHLGHEEAAGVVEDLAVVGTLGQRPQPRADRLLPVALAVVEVRQDVTQLTRLRTRPQQRLT